MKKIIILTMVTFLAGNTHAGIFDWFGALHEALIPTAHAPDQNHANLLPLGLSSKELQLYIDDPYEAVKKFRQAKTDIVYAELANAVYARKDIIGDWYKLDRKDDGETGFQATLYKNSKNGQLVLAIQGSCGDRQNCINDWKANIDNVAGVSVQSVQAIFYTKYLINKYGRNITLTGHSLGGGLAQDSAARFGLEAITFNSAAVSDENRKHRIVNEELPEKDDSKIRNYLLTGDIVNPLSSLLNNTGSNYGRDIYIDIYNPNDLSIEHSQDLMVEQLKLLGRAYDSLSENLRHQQSNINIQTVQTKVSSLTQGNTSHFGSVDYYFNAANNVPTNTNRQRETIQENPYLAAGSRIVEAPADIVLNWGARPADLDSHLTGPVDASGRERFHTFYANRGSLDAAPNALLYRDDTSHGVGRENLPEQTRINVTQPGVYNFYVHDYSNRHQTGSMEMSNSGARVSLHSAGNRELPEGRNLGTKVAEYGIPTNREGTAWHVFELDTRRNVITPVNTLYNVSDPTKVPVK